MPSEAYGMADLELRVPLSPDNVFEIGSITKQFTAVGILMLMIRLSHSRFVQDRERPSPPFHIEGEPEEEAR